MTICFMLFLRMVKSFDNVLEGIEQILQFEDLRAINGLFEQVQINESRTGVSWSDMIDLPSDAIYENLIIESENDKN